MILLLDYDYIMAMLVNTIATQMCIEEANEVLNHSLWFRINTGKDVWRHVDEFDVLIDLVEERMREMNLPTSELNPSCSLRLRTDSLLVVEIRQ